MKAKLITTLILITCILPCMAQHLSKKTEDYISSRVTLIYNSIIQNLNQIDSLSIEEIEESNLLDRNNLEEMYCSVDWNSLRSRVEKKESEEEDLFFDYDYWIDAQDYCDLHLINVKVEGIYCDRSVVSVVK